MTSIKSILVDAGQSSTSHGIPNIIRAQYNSLKVLWSILFVLSTAACSYLIFKSLSQFFDNEIVTMIEIKNDISLEFPTITVCNSLPWISTQGESFRIELRKKFNLSKYNYADIEWFYFYHSFINENRTSFGLVENAEDPTTIYYFLLLT